MSQATTVERNEWCWVLTRSLLVVALTFVPYLSAAVNAPAGHIFNGLLINVPDGNTYLAKMRQGYDGAWLFRLPFTPEGQDGVLVYTLYLGLGHLARLTGTSLIAVYHASRALAGLALLLTIYRLAAELTADVTTRRWVFRLGAFAGGLGFFSLLTGRHTSADLWIPEANTFFSIFTNPHFPLSFALGVWAILLVLRPHDKDFANRSGTTVWRWTSILGVAVALVLVAPYLIPAVWIAIGGSVLVSHLPLWECRHELWNSPVLRRGALVIGVTGIFLSYDFLASLRNPAIAAWSAQALMPSPEVIDYLLGFGVLLPLATLGSIKIWQDQHPVGLALFFWMLGVGLLVYAPLQLQRRFVAGVHVPVVTLAGIGLTMLLAHSVPTSMTHRVRYAVFTPYVRMGLLCTIVLLAYSTNLMLLIWSSVTPNQLGPYIYLSKDEWETLDWLSQQAGPQSVVLAPPRLSNFIPGRTGARVIYGHPMETIDAAHKRREVEAYYHGRLDALETMAMFERYRVTYVVFDPREFSYEEMDGTWVPDSARLAYSANGVLIFELDRADRSG